MNKEKSIIGFIKNNINNKNTNKFGGWLMAVHGNWGDVVTIGFLILDNDPRLQPLLKQGDNYKKFVGKVIEMTGAYKIPSNGEFKDEFLGYKNLSFVKFRSDLEHDNCFIDGVKLKSALDQAKELVSLLGGCGWNTNAECEGAK